MLQTVRDAVFGSAPIEIESAYGLTESVQRLKDVSKRSAFQALADEAAVGTVTEESISLTRVIPMVGNSFKPVFKGRFESHNGRIVLVGRFSISRSVKTFMAIWLAFVGMFTFQGVVSWLSNPNSRGNGVLPMGVGMVAFFVILVRVGIWFSRNDPAWLQDVMARALSAPDVAPSNFISRSQGRATPRQPGIPTTTWIALALVAQGIVSLVLSNAASLGITAHWPSRGTANPFVGIPPIWNGGVGLATLALGLGVFRRARWAWQGGFVFLAGGALFSVTRFGNLDIPPFDGVLRVIFPIMVLVVTGLWSVWWYAQRKHFVE